MPVSESTPLQFTEAGKFLRVARFWRKTGMSAPWSFDLLESLRQAGASAFGVPLRWLMRRILVDCFAVFGPLRDELRGPAVLELRRGVRIPGVSGWASDASEAAAYDAQWANWTSNNIRNENTTKRRVSLEACIL